MPKRTIIRVWNARKRMRKKSVEREEGDPQEYFCIKCAKCIEGVTNQNTTDYYIIMLGFIMFYSYKTKQQHNC